MFILKGLPQPKNPNLVYKLIKSLYGLKESSWTWYKLLDNYLILQGYTRLATNINIYLKIEKMI